MTLVNRSKLEAVNSELRELERDSPCLSFVPNVGQEKAFKFFRSLEKAPHIGLFGGANGVGKTATAGIALAGLTFGPDFLHDFMDKFQFFPEYKEYLETQNRGARIRLVCHADSMKVNGPLHQAITDWFPRGINPDNGKPLYNLSKMGKTYYSQIDFNIPGLKFQPSVEIKTHDQDVGAHAGSNLDIIICDEPFPEALWSEMIGRTRNGGHIFMFMTPLNMAGFLMDNVVDKVDGKDIIMTNATIWDNCIDIPGTRGHLLRSNIEKMIKLWTASAPDEVTARTEGTFTHLSGAMYKIFSEDAHCLYPAEEFKWDSDWPIYCIMDPHDAKYPAINWILQTPIGEHYIIREWPMLDYTQIGNVSYTISQAIQQIREIEAEFKHQVQYRVMDPNKGLFKHTGIDNQDTIQDLWRKAGLRFDLADNDDLDVGHKRVAELLYYDTQKPLSQMNHPKMRIFADRCPNTVKAMKRYGYKRNYKEGGSLTTNIDQKYKDFADLPRYYAVSYKLFQTVSEKGDFMNLLFSGRKNVEHK